MSSLVQELNLRLYTDLLTALKKKKRSSNYEILDGLSKTKQSLLVGGRLRTSDEFAKFSGNTEIESSSYVRCTCKELCDKIYVPRNLISGSNCLNFGVATEILYDRENSLLQLTHE